MRRSSRRSWGTADNLATTIKIAERELRLAENEVNRVRGLIESEQAAGKELDDAKLVQERARRVLQGFRNELALIEPTKLQMAANVRASDSSAELAKLNIQRCTVRAPFAGGVDDVAVEKGERVGVGAQDTKVDEKLLMAARRRSPGQWDVPPDFKWVRDQGNHLVFRRGNTEHRVPRFGGETVVVRLNGSASPVPLEAELLHNVELTSV